MGNLDLLENNENSDDLCGELRMRIFILLGRNENFGDFIGELKMRIFILLKSNENSVGKKAHCWRIISGVFGRLPVYWGFILGWGETKVNYYLG